MLKKTAYLKFLFLLTLSIIDANANDIGWFIGGEAGRSKALVNTPRDTEDRLNSGTFSVYGGYNFLSWLGVQGKYKDFLGQSNQDPDIDSTYANSILVAPKFFYRINKYVSTYSLTGLAFVNYAESKEAKYIGNSSWKGLGGYASIGIQLDASKHMKLQLNYDYVYSDLNEDDHEPDVTYEMHGYSLGIHYQH